MYLLFLRYPFPVRGLWSLLSGLAFTGENPPQVTKCGIGRRMQHPARNGPGVPQMVNLHGRDWGNNKQVPWTANADINIQQSRIIPVPSLIQSVGPIHLFNIGDYPIADASDLCMKNRTYLAVD